MTPINWQRIARAVESYKDAGYHYIETPWVVSMEASQVTFPNPIGLTNGKVPVGSAEQGFIELLIHGQLRPGKYVSAGPCFRPQDEGLWLSQPWFFKVELIHVLGAGDAKDPLLTSMIDTAESFFDYEGVTVTHEKTAEGWDLCLGDVEIGSYGIRSYGVNTWIYGTGLAEPRYTLALSLI